MKRSLDTDGLQRRLWIKPEEALAAAFPPTPEPLSDADVDDAAALRKLKAEQANKALWDFGGKMKQVQQDWKRLQEEIKHAPKRCRTDNYTCSRPLLLLNQYYWEQHLGSSISSIQGNNMFGINMYGSSSTLGQHLRGDGSHVLNNGPRHSSTGDSYQVGLQDINSNNLVPASAADITSEQQTMSPAAHSSLAPAASTTSSDCAAALDALPFVYDLKEVEAVCRQQQLMHLPASRRFSMALKMLKAAKHHQQEQQQPHQQQTDLLARAPSVNLVAVA